VQVKEERQTEPRPTCPTRRPQPDTEIRQLVWPGPHWSARTTEAAAIHAMSTGDIRLSKLHKDDNLVYQFPWKIILATFRNFSGLKLEFATVRLLELRVRIPSGAWMPVACECCIGTDLCDGPITRPGESCRMWRV
jgi:hypothetical protein